VVPLNVDGALQQHILKSAQPKLYSHNSIPETDTIKSLPPRDEDDLTPGERLAIHKYCVAQAKKLGTRTSMSTEELLYLQNKANEDGKNKSQKTHLDKLAEERDQKRQRMKYKGTSTSKKSHTQVIGEVIEKQMAVLADIWKDQQQKEVDKLQNKDKTFSVNDEVSTGTTTMNQMEDSKEHHRSKSKDRDRKHKKHKSKSRYRENSDDEYDHSLKSKHKKQKH